MYLSDDGVVGGGDGVEDPLDALQRFLVAGGDAIERLVVVLQRTTALAAPGQTQTDTGISLNTAWVWSETQNLPVNLPSAVTWRSFLTRIIHIYTLGLERREAAACSLTCLEDQPPPCISSS